MRGGFFQTLVTLMALVAMGLRAALPAGTMLESDNGQIVVTLCNGGAVTFDLGKREPGKPTHHDAPCPYAAAHAAAAPPSNHVSFSTPMAFVAAGAPQQVLRPGLGLAAPPPPATGPPFSA